MESRISASWVKSVLARSGYLKANNVEEIISVTEENLSGGNISNGSSLIRLTLTVKNTSGKTVSKKMICKSKRNESGQHDITELLLAFPVEIKLYGEVIKQIENILLKYKNIYKPWPEYYGSEGTNILLEDLEESGFGMKKDRKMDIDHANLAIKELGKYHALTMIVVEKGLVDPSWFSPIVYARRIEPIMGFASSAFNGLINSMRMHWGSQWKDTADKIVELSKNLDDKFESLCRSTQGQFDVINHGEYWLNNLVFSYDKNTGKVQHIKILDFQVSHYNSPCWDLSQFFFGSVMPDIREIHMKSLLEAYLDTLASHLRLFDYKGPVPSMTYLEETLKTIGLYGFMCSIMAPPFMLAASREGEKHDDDTQGKELLPSNHSACYQWQIVRDTTKKEVQYWLNQGLI